ncbi:MULTISPECIES: hypothetical protein [unclassified Bacillota]|nr:hypothetical protein DXB47_04230 [Firmicutes bacterium OM04-13BH]
MSVIGAIRDFIATCPYLDEFEETFSKVDIDFLEEKPTNYMVEAVPAEPIVKRYTNGDSIRRVAFHFCSRVFWGDVENIDTSEFYEHFQEWLEDCTRNREFPILDSMKEARSIRATTNGYMVDAEAKTARYAIQCEFTYFQKRRQ